MTIIFMERLKMTPSIRQRLDDLYDAYNKREYVHPDPLEFLYDYSDIRDREIVGLIASALAYGRVAQILKSVSYVLKFMGKSPRAFLMQSSSDDFINIFKNFKHRFADGSNLAALLIGIKQILKQYGTLYECFLSGTAQDEQTIFSGLNLFCQKLRNDTNPGHLVPLAERGSACKRMNLFLRWMVRKDAVDPGGWDALSPSKLIVPLDVHLHRISLRMGLTRRTQANMRTALEITSAFKEFAPDDPVRYDFALTRLGIRDDMNMDDFFYED